MFRETSIVFLFVNSAVNPFLTTFRINELIKAVRENRIRFEKTRQSGRYSSENLWTTWQEYAKPSLAKTAKSQGLNSYQSKPCYIAADEENHDARCIFNSILTPCENIDN